VHNFIEPFDGYGIIYRATSPSGKIYIGQTTEHIKKRISSHYYSSRAQGSKAHSAKMGAALRKYGLDMKWECLYRVPASELNDAEVAEINKHNSFKAGYNSTAGGEGIRGFRFSEETKTKMSRAKIGRKMPEHVIQLNSIRNKGSGNPMYGTKMSEEHKQKLIRINTGRIVSEEERIHMSIAGIGVKNTETHNANIKAALRKVWGAKGKSFYVFNIETGELVGEWDTISECSERLDLTRANVGACLRGKRRSCKGYAFKYKGGAIDANKIK
jgi:group I intron endonuclease